MIILWLLTMIMILFDNTNDVNSTDTDDIKDNNAKIKSTNNTANDKQ